MKSIRLNNLFAVLSVLLLLTSCFSDDEPDPSGPKIGPISEKDFNALPVPSYGVVAEAFENIRNQKSHLIGGASDELATALFAEVKGLSANGELPGNDASTLLEERLSREEWILVIEDSNNGYFAFSVVEDAFLESQNSFSCDPGLGFINTKIDALKHAYWSALVLKNTDQDFAERLANAHHGGSSSIASKMDLHNDKMGRELALQFPSAVDEELLTILLQYDFVFLQNGGSIDTNLVGLVYLEGRSRFDVKMKGFLTNPDSGGPWEIEFDMYECGDQVRGNYTITRGITIQKRRFSGIKGGDGTISLMVSNPFVFENPGGMYYCAGTKMTLVGDETKLDGKWTSTNCYRGGTVSMQAESG